MEIHIYNEQHSLAIYSHDVEAIVLGVLEEEKTRCDEVSIHFVDTPTICLLHQDYFDDPSPTDCISFPIDDSGTEGYCILGEVFVCPQTAIEYSRENETSPYEEVSLYIIHGLLHLLGYDDHGVKEAAMRAKEQYHLSHLKSKGLLLKEGSCPS